MKERIWKERSTIDVIVTTYDMAIKEVSFLRKFTWEYLVVDEAHKLKNANSRLACTLRQMVCTCRLLLTGTPLQNDLLELWSLLNFIIPDIFKSSESFQDWFEGPFSGDSELTSVEREAVLDRLHRVLRPFILRRTKTEVLKDLT
eukprot:UN27762